MFSCFPKFHLSEKNRKNIVNQNKKTYQVVFSLSAIKIIKVLKTKYVPNSWGNKNRGGNLLEIKKNCDTKKSTNKEG